MPSERGLQYVRRAPFPSPSSRDMELAEPVILSLAAHCDHWDLSVVRRLSEWAARSRTPEPGREEALGPRGTQEEGVPVTSLGSGKSVNL